MTPPIDLRHRVEIVLQRTRDLAAALQDLPDRQDAAKDAIWRMSPTERAQLVRHLVTLEANLAQVVKDMAWLRAYCTQAPPAP